MAIWTVAHSKGGVGKTAVATNIAVAAALAGKRVLLVDSDPQNSSVLWRSLRETDDIAALSILTPTLHKDLPAIAANYDLVVVDTGSGLASSAGGNSKIYRSAVAAADMVIIPCLASQVDLFAAGDVVEVVRYARDFKPILPAVWVLNQIISGTKLSQEVRGALADFKDDVSLCESMLCARTAYRTAYGLGLGVLELKGKDRDVKAAAEAASLFAELSEISEPNKIAGGK
jgi:chromosome partitioning protein